MQPVLLSQSNREDDEPRFILLASIERMRDRSDSQHLRSDYRPLILGLQGEENVTSKGESKRHVLNTGGVSNIRAVARRESVWQNAEEFFGSISAGIQTQASDRGNAAPPNRSGLHSIRVPSATLVRH